MSTKKQKERKKKNREKIARYRVIKRRENLRKERKQALEEQIKQKIAENEVCGKLQPYVKSNLVVELTEEEKQKKISEVQSKIEHNLKILEALEQEYDQEQEQKKKINEDLEKEGFLTIKEKMDALHDRALEIEGKKEEYDAAQKEYLENKEK